MNITKIYSADLNSRLQNNNISRKTNYPNYGLVIAQPMKADVVSFQASKTKKVQQVVVKEVQAALARKEARALRDSNLLAEVKHIPDKTAPTKKNLEGSERTWGVSKSTSEKIHRMIVKPQKQIHNFMYRFFGDLIASDVYPNNLLLEIADREKSIISIMEKSSTRKWNSIKEILEKMTDLNGAKLVMNYKTGKQDAENVLTRLIPLIKAENPVVELMEIELQRPSGIKNLSLKEQEEFDYFSKEFLDRLEDAQEEVINGLETDVDKIKLIDRPLPKYTKGNYCALHLLLKLTDKEARPFELQIMGAHEAKGKNLNDKEFKFFGGKLVDKIFSPLIDLWQRLKVEENAEASERYAQYSKDAMLDLRKREIQEFLTQKIKKGNPFLSISKYNLPPEYGWDEQYKIMQECEQKLKNLEKAREAKEAKRSEMKIQETKIESLFFIKSIIPNKTIRKIKEKFHIHKHKKRTKN